MNYHTHLCIYIPSLVHYLGMLSGNRFLISMSQSNKSVIQYIFKLGGWLEMYTVYTPFFLYFA